MKELNHRDFISRLKNGHNSAYRELDRQLFPWFRNFIIQKYEISFEDAKDIVQDVAKRIIEKINQFNPGRGDFIPWAFQILRNITIDWLRRNRKFDLVSLSNAGFNFAYNEEENEEEKDDLSPIERLPSEVRSAFFKLNSRYKQCLGLLLLGSPTEENMRILKIKTKDVYYTLKSRTLSKLKEEVNKIENGEI